MWLVILVGKEVRNSSKLFKEKKILKNIIIQIFGIPRFMLFSANGNVISTNAPRPSSDEIRGLLNANLGGLPNL